MKPNMERLEDRLVLDTSLSSRFFQAGLLEFKSPSVAVLYTQGLGRAPDQGGLAFWSTQTPLAAAEGILGSAEFDMKHPGIGDKILPMYEIGLGRAPDDPGWLYWTGSHLPSPTLTAPRPPPAVNLITIGHNAQGTAIVAVEGFDPGPTEGGAATWRLTWYGISFTADDLTRRSDKSFADANVASGFPFGVYQEMQLS